MKRLIALAYLYAQVLILKYRNLSLSLACCQMFFSVLKVSLIKILTEEKGSKKNNTPTHCFNLLSLTGMLY